MPYYEYYCPERRTIYTFYARSTSLAGAVPRCPDGGECEMRKMVSGFAITGRAGEPGDAAASDLADAADDPRMERALAAMEREMGGLDQENPDPRQLGRLMKQMCEVTGEKPGEAAEEMIRRLESGEDPEKLEEQFGDVLDDDGAFFGNAGEGMKGEVASVRGRRARAKVFRDPKVYELEEFVDR